MEYRKIGVNKITGKLWFLLLLFYPLGALSNLLGYETINPALTIICFVIIMGLLITATIDKIHNTVSLKHNLDIKYQVKLLGHVRFSQSYPIAKVRDGEQTKRYRLMIDKSTYEPHLIDLG